MTPAEREAELTRQAAVVLTALRAALVDLTLSPFACIAVALELGLLLPLERQVRLAQAAIGVVRVLTPELVHDQPPLEAS